MCAIVGVSLPADATSAIQIVYDCLRMLQGRGQDGSGIVAATSSLEMIRLRALGLVWDVYPTVFLNQSAASAIGHNRYATQGVPNEINLQPHLARCRDGRLIALASNGDLPRYAEYRRQLEAVGESFASTNDGEFLAKWLARSYDRLGTMPAAIQALQAEIEGAYAAVVLFDRRVYAFRDRQGFRPMVIGQLPSGGVAIVSEEAALDIHLADRSSYMEVPAGAVLECVDGRVITHTAGHPATAACIFEFVYFARPDGCVFGRPVSLVRRRCGWRLARSISGWLDLDRTLVVGVPDSASELADGVAEGLAQPDVSGLVRSHGAVRTFIAREQRVRDEGVRYKFNPNHWHISGRHVILVDDSIVRGTTMHRIVRMLRRHGAASIRLLVGSPPVRWPCFMGIATPTRQELLASHRDLSAIAAYLEVDDLAYLSLGDLLSSVGPIEPWERERFAAYLGPQIDAAEAGRQSSPTQQFCDACFSGRYPLVIPPVP